MKDVLPLFAADLTVAVVILALFRVEATPRWRRRPDPSTALRPIVDAVVDAMRDNGGEGGAR